jgi:hypothetical protein
MHPEPPPPPQAPHEVVLIGVVLIGVVLIGVVLIGVGGVYPQYAGS